MSFEQQSELLVYLLDRCLLSMGEGVGTVATLVVTDLDRPQLADLAITALRLRKMAAYESDIKAMVTGR